jgi:hypothetical protein
VSIGRNGAQRPPTPVLKARPGDGARFEQFESRGKPATQGRKRCGDALHQQKE